MKTIFHTWFFFVLSALIILSAGVYGVIRFAVGSHTPAVSAAASAMRHYSASELVRYDGSDSALPILIGMNGEVYDVSAGRDYYVPGGVYHFLAGKDSSTELNLIGGDIIRRKYPVVGVLDR
jgi:predicted heme/steroid binding protein